MNLLCKKTLCRALVPLVLCLGGTLFAEVPISGRIDENSAFGKGVLQAMEPALTLLGRFPAEAFESAGMPDLLQPFRGVSEDQDDVVSSYTNGVSLFFFENRVWQVRIQPPCSLPSAIAFGMEKEALCNLLGIPFAEDEDSTIYMLPDRGYPVRIRFFFDGKGLNDIYIYRADY
ncbi:hypothetical protein [Sediminispirochaeta smaragdinae]|uniref:Beta-lactamase-inhibitor-like PepSY-like domain-containing protein n=1 Tax=Sediminispirochaeta smaragdinae (strain DSM 11293 / JCM 15392 / SEBR 4228) TaxID=573413 RepID=E1R272_SEDSS|nr:hypothetical protein [Sediminispirochaeta smaragdinae]ADK81957.1 hypothetical protein Spirs_2854 [Sediminispirochaeta smaragdinae DSM 11293]